MQKLSATLTATLIVCISGCASWNIFNRDTPAEPQKAAATAAPEPAAQPARIVAFWSEMTFEKPGDPTVRGLGGRLMFYDPTSDEPIETNGKLTIYAFDETARERQATKPTRKYEFTSEQFAIHYSRSPIGHAYSFWIPWDNSGGEQREI
ncbi:MAG: hypothetical protein WD176_02160, partial [Pirellulales bacterium]